MAPLAFIFLLDYSGSMDQLMDKAPKTELVEKQVQSLLSTAGPQDPSEAIIFGTQPRWACDDIVYWRKSSSQLQKDLHPLKPGAFGKTPLTKGFRLLVDSLKKQPTAKAFVITDGADTCGENPCEYLKNVDKTLKTPRPYDIYLLGLDLKEDRPQMECFKNLHLNNFEIHFSEISSKNDLLTQLQDAQLPPDQIQNEIIDSQLTKDTAIRVFKMKNQPPVRSPSPSERKSPKNELRLATVEIIGAPSEAHFHIENDQTQHSWQGPFAVQVPGGQYKIQFVDADNGKEITFRFLPGTLTKIPWAQLMKLTTGQVHLSSPSLTLLWTPDAATEVIHGNLKPIQTTASLDKDKVDTSTLPFGTWSVEIISPPWLVKKIPPKNIVVKVRDKKEIDLKELFKGQVRWVDPQQKTSGQVLVLTSPSTQEERHFLPAGQSNIPIPAAASERWLTP